MKANKVGFVVVGLVLCIGATGVGQAVEQPAIQWGRSAHSLILDANELAKIRAIFPAWKVKQSTWPSDTQISSNSVRATRKQKATCMNWLSKFMRKQYLPADLDKHLIAMNDWGLIKKETEQKRLCDVFIARYRKGPYVIHIQESPMNVIIAVADERLAKDARTDHKELVIATATSIVNEALKPDPNSENLHVFEVVRDGRRISRVLWLIESVTKRDKDGKKCTNLRKAWKIGARTVGAETDGRFVRFEIVKCIKGPAVFPNPYVERFKAKSNDEPDQ